MTVNGHSFEGAAASGTYLSARGFDTRGGGGIKDPRRVLLPKGAVLVRLYDR